MPAFARAPDQVRHLAIDRRRAFSLRHLTGYRLPDAGHTAGRAGTTHGRTVSAVTDESDELGTDAIVPQPLDAKCAQLSAVRRCARCSSSGRPRSPRAGDRAGAPSFGERPVWQGAYAVLTGPIIAAGDDDHHQYYRGVPLEICSKTSTFADAETPADLAPSTVGKLAGDVARGRTVSCSPEEGLAADAAIPSPTSTPSMCHNLKGHGDETRLRILESLLGENLAATDPRTSSVVPQPHVSHHLPVLRDAGLVEGHRRRQTSLLPGGPGRQRILRNRERRCWTLDAANCDFPTSTLWQTCRHCQQARAWPRTERMTRTAEQYASAALLGRRSNRRRHR